MSEEILGEVESGQGENLGGSFFAIFGEEPASAMEISHQQVLFKSRYSNLQWSGTHVCVQSKTSQDIVPSGGLEAALRRTSPHCS